MFCCSGNLSCIFCQVVDSSHAVVPRMQLNIKCRYLSVCPANQWKATHPPWGFLLRSNAETYLYALPISEKQHINPEDATRDLYALPISEKQHFKPEDATWDLNALPINEKQHIHPEDVTWDQMQRLIWTLCQSVKRNKSTLRVQLEIKCRDFICNLCQSVKSNTSTLKMSLEMQLEIKCRDLSVRSANQWKATH